MTTTLKVGGDLPKIEKVRPVDGLTLRIKFKGTSWRSQDLSGLLSRYRLLAPLRDPGRFRQARVIDDGAAIGWPEGLDIGASTLWRIAEEQKAFTSADFVRWQRELGLSNSQTGDALGLSLATIKNYRNGAAIPTAVAIACRAMAAEPTTLAAHLHPRKAGRPKLAA